MYVGLYPNERPEMGRPEYVAANVVCLGRVWFEQQDKSQLHSNYQKNAVSESSAVILPFTTEYGVGFVVAYT